MANNTIYPYGTDGQLPSNIGIVNDLTTGGADKALSAEMGKELNESLFGEEQITATKADADIYYIKAGVEVQPTSANRLRCVLPITEGQHVVASCSLGQGVAASIYDTVAKCKAADTDYLQTFSYSYVSEVQGTATASGYLAVSLAKPGNGDFSEADATLYYNALYLIIGTSLGGGAITNIEGRLSAVEQEVAELDYKSVELSPLFLGTLLQKSMTASGLSDTNKNYRVSMASNTVVPRENATLKFLLPQGYGVGIRSGVEAQNLSNNDFWYLDGDTFTFASDVHYFRLCFAKGVTNLDPSLQDVITLQEVEDLIDGGDIRVSVVGQDEGIIARNEETEKYVKAVMRDFVTTITDNGSLTKLPIFAHTSDLHGDARRFNNYMDYCDYLKVDAALVSGDTVAVNPVDSMQYVLDIADMHTTPVLYCQGNHDSRNLKTAQAQNEAGIGYLITKNSSSTPVGDTYPTYYYQDFSAKKIRVISVNLYELSHKDDYCNFTQSQCEWLIATLASTPANYGVLIMFHSPEAQPTKDSSYGAFYQDILAWSGWQANLTGNVFRQIVDAFISKTTATVSYQVGGSTITVSADFTGVASGVEFIAFVNGHIHADLVGYVAGATNMQLNLNVSCGVAIYGSTYQGLANLSDVPRGCVGATQDAFNIYAIDRSSKTVRIARVGSNVSGYDLEERKFMAIPYAE